MQEATSNGQQKSRPCTWKIAQHLAHLTSNWPELRAANCRPCATPPASPARCLLAQIVTAFPSSLKSYSLCLQHLLHFFCVPLAFLSCFLCVLSCLVSCSRPLRPSYPRIARLKGYLSVVCSCQTDYASPRSRMMFGSRASAATRDATQPVASWLQRRHQH